MRFAVQSDGDLVIYSKDKQSSASIRPVWRSNTGGKNGEYILFLQDTGKITYWSFTDKVAVF